MHKAKCYFAVVFLLIYFFNLNAAEQIFSINYKFDPEPQHERSGRKGGGTFGLSGKVTDTAGKLKILYNGRDFSRENIGHSATDVCSNVKTPVQISNEKDFLIITESHAINGCALRYIIRKDGSGGYTENLTDGVWGNRNFGRVLTPEHPGSLKTLENYATANTTYVSSIADAASTTNTPLVVLQQPNASQTTNEADRLVVENRIREQIRLELEAKAKEQARVDQETKLREQSRIVEDSNRLASQKKKDEEFVKLQNELDQLKKQLSSSQNSGARKALVIGNDSYRSVTRLQNAREDAKAVAEMLTYAGWKVSLKLDLTEKEMKNALRNFKNDVNPGDETTFFYAGHGVQFGTSNYLLPIDTSGDSEEQVRDDAIPLQRILDDMIEKKAKFTLALLDACRDNPFKTAGRSIGGGTRGLAPTSAATGQMVVFSAGNGQQALDNLGGNDKNKNGLFTRIFLQEARKKGQTIDLTIKNVRSEVARLARSVGHDQVPAIYDQVLGDFYIMK